MKKIFTTLTIVLTALMSLPAQIAWDQVKVSTTEIPGADSAYFSIICRGGAFEALCQQIPDSVTGKPNPGVTNLEPGDSLVWRIEMGAPYGTSPRIRIVNVMTGQYLYMGKKGTETKRVYMGGRENAWGDCKDFFLYDRGPRVASEYYYNITDVEGHHLNGMSAGNIGWGNNNMGADGRHMWRFNRKVGPMPKPAPKPSPTLEIATLEPTVHAGGNATIQVKANKGTADLTGNALLYVGDVFVATLILDATGAAEYVVENLSFGEQTFTFVYTDDMAYEPASAEFTMQVLPDLNAKNVEIEITAHSAEVHQDVKADFFVTDTDGTPVPQGTVYVMINGNLKNSFTPDVLGMGTIVFPNLLPGTDTISAYYLGDKETFLDSDTTFVTVEITESTATEKPYPVYYDLGTIFEVQQYLEKYTSAETTRSFNVTFAADSFPAIQLATDTAVVKTMMASYNAQALKYESTDLKDMRSRADQFTIPFGTGARPSWMIIKTPWMNKGSYNIYLSQRVNIASGMFPTVSVNGKEVYYPNAELVAPSFRSYSGNNVRRWNSRGHNNNLAMHYFGSVNIESSGVHDLKFDIKTGSQDAWIDMIQFIPVDQDSLRVNEPSAIGLGKVYYPLFDLGGFARFQDDPTSVIAMADLTEMAVPYQATDPTHYTTYPFTIEGLGTVDVMDLYGDYVIVYRAEDKWTRVAEGYIVNNEFTGELPMGDYYYQEINYIDMGTPGAAGYRTFISDGTFSVGGTSIPTVNERPSVYGFAINRTLTVRGIDAGDQVLVADLAGKIIDMQRVGSDGYAKQLDAAVYIVKVISAKNGSHVMKVIVK